METKKEQAREVSCSVRVQTDDHSGTNTVHAPAVEKSSTRLQSDPWHVTEVGRAFEEKRRKEGVRRRRSSSAVCLLFRPSSIIFLVFLEQRCSLKTGERQFRPFRLLSCQFPLFPHPTQKHENFDLPLWNFVALSSASFNVIPLWSCS